MNVVFALSDHPLETELLAEWSRERPGDRVGLVLFPRVEAGPGEPGRLGWAMLRWCVRRLIGVERPWPTPGRFARALGLDVLRARDVDDPALVPFVKGRHAELLVSWDRPRQPTALSSLPRLGTINAHPGAHPGPVAPAPWFRELVDGEGRLSVALHRPLDVDRLGPQLAEAWHEAEEHTTPFLHHYQAVQIAARLLPLVAEELAKGEVAEVDPRGDAPAPRGLPDAGDRRRLRERGHPLRSWRERLALLAGEHDGFVAHHERVHAARPN